MLKYFGVSAVITVLAVLAALIFAGPAATLSTLILIAIEIAFSFDNAIVNAKVLERLSHAWQHAFLTIGMVVAILGMRLLFPIVIVMASAHLPWSQVINEALHHPDLYSQHLAKAHAAISAFGGSFLLTLALYFLFDDNREELWLERLERPLQRIGGSFWLPPLMSALTIGLVAIVAGDDRTTALHAGLLGVLSYAAIKLLVDGLDRLSPKKQKLYTGWLAVLTFLYLQVLDASFSFDGVLGAFAISNKVLLIALGLGVGAIWVRSLTVFMVRKGTLSAYIYLEHGAHYAILVLAIALLGGIFFEVSNALTGIVGLGIIGASFIASRQAMRAQGVENRSR